MRRFIVGFLIVLLCEGAVLAEACTTCGDKNHYNFHNKYGGKGGNVTVNPTISNVQQSWLTANPTQQVSIGSPTVGPVSIGDTTVGVTVNTSGGGGGGNLSGYLIQNFPEPYVTIPAAPLSYQGPFDSSIYKDDQIWFNRLKWMKDMIENLPNGGKVSEAIYERTKPVNFIQPREGKDFDKSKLSGGNYYYLGNVYCKSSGPDDNPGTVWGGCARKLLERGCSYAYKIAGAITYGARSKATNQSGGASFAGLFGQIFGFNAGAGASNTDHDASGYEIVNLTWACVGILPQQ